MSLLFKGLLEFITRQLTFKILLFVIVPLSVIALLLFGRSTRDDSSIGRNARTTLTQVESVDSSASSQAVQQVIIVDDASSDNTTINSQAEESLSTQPLASEQADTGSGQTSAQSVLAPQTKVELNNDLGASLSQDSEGIEPQVTLIDSINTGSTNTDSTTAGSTNIDLGTQAEIDRIVIPAIDMDIPVTELGWHQATNEADQIFSEWDVAINAAGWHKNSARPGEGGNVVMSGHNNIYGAVFRELDQLDQGDEAFVYVGDRLYTYEITQVLVVPEVYADAEQRADNAKWIEAFDDDRITLVSCWPRDDNSHRIIVIGYAVEG